jgi:hypothetical protein
MDTVGSANSTSLQCRINIELEGILAHAWCEDTAAKILAPACWIQSVDPASTGRSDISAFTTWTKNPSNIPKVVWLIIADNESTAHLGGLPPYLQKKDALCYQVIVHIRNTADFDPQDPSPAPSPPESDDGDNGNPERHHLSRGHGPRIQGFRCARGIIDGGADGSLAGHAASGRQWSRGAVPLRQHHDDCTRGHYKPAPVVEKKQDPPVDQAGQMATLPLRPLNPGTHSSSNWWPRRTPSGTQEFSRPRILEARLLREPLLNLHPHKPSSRDENGWDFSRTVPFRFLHFSVHFRICEIPFSYLRK